MLRKEKKYIGVEIKMKYMRYNIEKAPKPQISDVG